MSSTFRIGTGDFLFDLKGSLTTCEDLSVCAMALSPSSKFMESSSKELVSTDMELVAGFFSKSKYELSNSGSSSLVGNPPNSEVSRAGSG